MTTNQTIDGVLVPRETLQKWLDDIGPIRHVTQYAALKRDELRALLDTFESQYDGMTSAQAQAVSDGIDGLLFGKPAAQPQGEPVAWQYRVSAGPQTGWSLWHDGKGEEFKQSYQVETRPLYAEQPAPVAVVLPERKARDGFGEFSPHSNGWNACLDDLKRLNPSRPAHANPPPSAEPSGTHHDNDGLDEWRKPACCGSCPAGCVIQKESK